MPQSYESLSNEEKASLWGCLVADDQVGRLMLERLSPGLSKSTYYRHYQKGINSLQQKGYMDFSYNPTDIVLPTLPQSILKEVVNQLRSKAQRLEKEHWELVSENRRLQSQEDRLTKQIEDTKPLRDLIKDFEKVGVDDNWMCASIALNLVEPVIKKKLEELGVKLPERTDFPVICEQLKQVLKEKENRELKPQLLTPKHFYAMRCEIDHWGHKYRLTRKQADNIVDEVTEFISDVLC